MSGSSAAAAAVVIGMDARYLDASPEALVIYGVTVEEFRTRSVGDFSPEFREVVRGAWAEWCSTDAWPRVVTGASIRRPDGTVAVAHATFRRVADDAIEGRLELLDPGSPAARSTQRILDEWRHVEDRIRAAGEHDMATLGVRAAALRDEYQRVFRSVGLGRPEPLDPSATGRPPQT